MGLRRNSAVDPRLPCAEQSIRSNEPIAGTAIANTDIWLLLEYRERWEARLEQCALPAGVRDWLAAAVERYPNARPLLMRRPTPSEQIRFMVVRSGPEGQIHRFDLDCHEALTRIDLDQVLAGEHCEASGPKPQELYLICTHGRRDSCCGKAGMAFYNAMVEQEFDGELWQTTHQGGHRFAATMVYLPAGIHYGRLVPGDAARLVSAHRNGHIHDLQRYRGQTGFPKHVQTADAWLRHECGDTRIDSVRFLSSTELNDDQHDVAFATSDGQTHHLTLAPEVGNIQRMSSCAADAPSRPHWFKVVRHEAQTHSI